MRNLFQLIQSKQCFYKTAAHKINWEIIFIHYEIIAHKKKFNQFHFLWSLINFFFSLCDQLFWHKLMFILKQCFVFCDLTFVVKRISSIITVSNIYTKTFHFFFSLHFIYSPNFVHIVYAFSSMAWYYLLFYLIFFFRWKPHHTWMNTKH